MRRGLALLLVFALLFTFVGCSVSFTPGEDSETTEESATEHTFVITTQGLTGLYRMADGVKWRENTMCALQYLGSRSSYASNLRALYLNRFSVVDEESFDSMHRVDAGGDDVYLVVPRFELENISVFGIQTDSAGEVHILKQHADLEEPFLLFCDSSQESPNVQLSVSLKNTAGYYKMIPYKNMFSTVVSFPGGYQPIENS